MSRTDVRLGQLFRTYINGVPLDLASRLLPFRTRFGLGLGLHVHVHVHAHAKVQQQYAGQPTPSTSPPRYMSLKALQTLVTHLEQTVSGLKVPTQQTEWADYYAANNNYGADGLDTKERVVQSFLRDRPRTRSGIWVRTTAASVVWLVPLAHARWWPGISTRTVSMPTTVR